MSAMSTPPHVPGYAVEGLLGSGGDAQVWLAVDQSNRRRVAVKQIRNLTSADRYRLHREAALQAGIVHPHVLRVLGIHDGDDLVLVLELAEGGSLLGLITARGALAPGEVVTACAPIAQALDAVHRRGLVHADVSCGNVLFTAEGRPVLSDLGVARLAGEQSSEVGVTPGFTAPEVLVGDSPGPAADIYSLAVTVRTALVGVLPDDPRAALVKSPPLPAAPIEVIERALGAEPRNRPTAAELAQALFGIAQPRPLRLLPPKPVHPLRPDPRAAFGAGAALNGPGAGQPSPEAATHRVPRRPGPADGSGQQSYVGRRSRREGGAGRPPAGSVPGAVAGLGLAAGSAAGGAVGGLGSGAGAAAAAGAGVAGPPAAFAGSSASAARSTLDAAAAASRQNRDRLGGHAQDGTTTSVDMSASAAAARTHRSPRERTIDDSLSTSSPPAARAAASPMRADTVAGARSASPGRSARAAAGAGAGAGSSSGRGAGGGSGSGSGIGRSERRGAGEASSEGRGRRRDITKLVLLVVIPALLAGAALIGWQWAKSDRDAASVVSALRPVGEGKGAVSATCGGPAPAPSTPPPTPDDWTTVVRELNEARATAFVDADPSELCDVYVPTSATLESDLELMNLYNSRGVRAQGLLFEVEKVSLVSQEAGRVVLEITDELPAYPLVDDEGETKATQPGKKSMTWRAELLPAPDGSGWRFG